MPVTRQNVESVFTYHAPRSEQLPKYQALRDKAKELAFLILDDVPQCADQQAALRLLRECVMTANAAISLDGEV